MRSDFGLGNSAENISSFKMACRAVDSCAVINFARYNKLVYQIPIVFKIKPIRIKKTLKPRFKFAI